VELSPLQSVSSSAADAPIACFTEVFCITAEDESALVGYLVMHQSALMYLFYQLTSACT